MAFCGCARAAEPWGFAQLRRPEMSHALPWGRLFRPRAHAPTAGFTQLCSLLFLAPWPTVDLQADLRGPAGQDMVLGRHDVYGRSGAFRGRNGMVSGENLWPRAVLLRFGGNGQPHPHTHPHGMARAGRGQEGSPTHTSFQLKIDTGGPFGHGNRGSWRARTAASGWQLGPRQAGNGVIVGTGSRRAACRPGRWPWLP